MSPGRVVATVSMLGALVVVGLHVGASPLLAGSPIAVRGWTATSLPVGVTVDVTTGEVVRVGPGTSVVLDARTGDIFKIN